MIQLPNTLTITARYVLRSEGMVWRYDITTSDSRDRGVKYGQAVELLQICGLSADSARTYLRIAEQCDDVERDLDAAERAANGSGASGVLYRLSGGES